MHALPTWNMPWCYYPYVKTKSSELFCLSQIFQFVLYSWSVWEGTSAERTLKTCGGHTFIPKEQSSLGSASLKPPELFRLFCSRTVPFANHANFLWRQGIKLEVLLRFENFQIVAHGFLGCHFLEKYRIFHFQVLMHQKKCWGYLGVAAYVTSRHITRYTFRIYIVLYGYKLFLKKCVGL